MLGYFLAISLSVYLNSGHTSDLLEESGILEDRIEAIIDGIPDKFKNHGGPEIYSPPSPQEQIDFANEVFHNLYYSQFEEAATNALDFGYTLTEFTEGQNVYYILERDQSLGVSNFYHWGTYVFNREASKGQLIIQAPHPLFDTDTGVQAVRVFQHVEASFLFISGTHRCNTATISGCAGVSNACNSNIGGVAPPAEFMNDPGDYRESDVAHATNSMFDYLTRWLENEEPEHYFYIQLHGFGQGVNEPDLIISGGKDENSAAPNPDILSQLSLQLILEWDNLHNDDLYIEIAHDDDDHNFNTLLATTNTQGRYINGNQINPCTSSSGTTNTGRFIHIEQGKVNDATEHMRLEHNWIVLIQAINNVFIDAPLPVEFKSFDVSFNKDHVEIKWETATEEGNEYFEVEKALMSSDFKPIATVQGQGYSSSSSSYFVRDYGLTDYAYYRIRQYDLGGNSTTTEARYLDISFYRKKIKGEFFIRPNHGASSNITVHMPEWSGKAQLTITDVTGRVNIALSSFERATVEGAILDFLEKASPGKYVLRIYSNGLNRTTHFIKY